MTFKQFLVLLGLFAALIVVLLWIGYQAGLLKGALECLR